MSLSIVLSIGAVVAGVWGVSVVAFVVWRRLFLDGFRLRWL